MEGRFGLTLAAQYFLHPLHLAVIDERVACTAFENGMPPVVGSFQKSNIRHRHI